MFLYESFAKVVIITQSCKYLSLKMKNESEIIMYSKNRLGTSLKISPQKNATITCFIVLVAFHILYVESIVIK